MSLYGRYKRLRRGDRMFLMFCIGPLVSIGIISVLAGLLINTSVAAIIQMSLMLAWIVMVATYIVVNESKRR